MKLYHGSYMEIKKPRVDVNVRGLDFGRGFYLSENIEQAKAFALRFSSQKLLERLSITKGTPTLNIYEFDFDKAAGLLQIRTFEAPSTEWFDFVVANRQNITTDDSGDLIIGPVANDKVITTIRLYENGLIGRDEALSRFNAARYDRQFVLKTADALKLLSFENSEIVGSDDD
jgi:hypothetical protein